MINWDRIEELREEVGSDGLAEVLTLFCEEVEEILDFLPRTSPETLPAHLHALKGSALNIGLEQVSQLCQAAESKLPASPTSQSEIQAIQSAYLFAKNDLQSITQNQ